MVGGERDLARLQGPGQVITPPAARASYVRATREPACSCRGEGVGAAPSRRGRRAAHGDIYAGIVYGPRRMMRTVPVIPGRIGCLQ